MCGLYCCTIAKHGLLSKKLKAFEMWLYRRMLRSSWTSRTTNKEVLTRMNTRFNLVNMIKIQKTAYLGHIMHHQEYSQSQLIIEGKIEGKRGLEKKKHERLDQH